MTNKILYNIAIAISLLSLIACDDYLDREPLSDVTPQVYFSTESDLATYTISSYDFPTHKDWNMGTFTYDNATDNQASASANNKWAPGKWKVSNKGGAWEFSQIRKINYFLDNVLPKFKAGNISGNITNIKHYIGEAYFMRAYAYFDKVKELGDFPIIKHITADNEAELIETSKRRPRNEVARFMLKDLDSAILLMKDAPVAKGNRLSKQAALLLKSRIALYEGTWLKYHKGTARVPKGKNWPGEGKDYLSNFTIDIDSEINFFLEEAMKSAKQVAETMTLTPNNSDVGGKEVFENPYFKMFGDLDMSSYSEIILWRDYDRNLFGHHTMHYLPYGGNSGYTKSLVDAFLMKNGLPIYTSNSGYAGDDKLSLVKKDRDERLQLFMMAENEYMTKTDRKFEYPNIIDKVEQRAVTGYNIKKGFFPDERYFKGDNAPIDNGCIVFRATEAYLNYIEACYVKNGNLDGNATTYWKQIRKRAGVSEDFEATISATNLSKEQDWAKYSGQDLVDTKLYNIRRERRCELIAEGMRMDDLKRWRALDKVSNYQIEGFKIWGSMNDWYKKDGKTTLAARPAAQPNISPKSASLYLRPYQIVETNNDFYNGYNWNDAHYLSPIAFDHFRIASHDSNANNSVIYQNPGWPIAASGTPIGL